MGQIPSCRRWMGFFGGAACNRKGRGARGERWREGSREWDVGVTGKASFRTGRLAGRGGQGWLDWLNWLLADLTCRCQVRAGRCGVGLSLSLCLCVCTPLRGCFPNWIHQEKTDRPTALTRSECESDFHWSPLPSPLESTVLQYIHTTYST